MTKVRLGIFSDLHLEFAPWEYAFKPDIIYVNAGDTHPNPAVRKHFQEKVEASGSQYFEVLGNHDHYGGEFPNKQAGLGMIPIDDKNIIVGATMWTKLSPDGFEDYKNALVDYRFIKGMTYEKYMDAYNWSLEFLSDMVNMSGFNVVGIVTHHSPSMQSLHERYRDSTMNHFFHNDTDDLVKALNPKVWIHGHTHDESFYKLGDTQVICNPRGYPNEYNHKGYEPIYYDLEV